MFIDWSADQPMAQWLINKPDKITYQSHINWKNAGYHITICCLDRNGVLSANCANHDTIFHNVPLIKSLLQKAVRRQMTEIALKTAKHFIQMDLDGFLRRLYVIMLEDVSLHPSVSALIWLTSAVSKGYQIKEHQLDWLMGLVQYLCIYPNKFYTHHVIRKHRSPSSKSIDPPLSNRTKIYYIQCYSDPVMVD